RGRLLGLRFLLRTIVRGPARRARSRRSMALAGARELLVRQLSQQPPRARRARADSPFLGSAAAFLGAARAAARGGGEARSRRRAVSRAACRRRRARLAPDRALRLTSPECDWLHSQRRNRRLASYHLVTCERCSRSRDMRYG